MLPSHPDDQASSRGPTICGFLEDVHVLGSVECVILVCFCFYSVVGLREGRFLFDSLGCVGLRKELGHTY